MCTSGAEMVRGADEPWPRAAGTVEAAVSDRFLVIARMESLGFEDCVFLRVSRDALSCESGDVVSGSVDTRERPLRSPTEGSQPPVEPGLALLWIEETSCAASKVGPLASTESALGLLLP